MKVIRWDEAKNQLLQLQRDLSFEQVLAKIESGEILERKTHPNQEILVIELNGYICYVPFVENDEDIFLKTIIPSRKLGKLYGAKDEK